MLLNIQNQIKRKINVIISLYTSVVYVARINCILSPPNWICFVYKVVLTIWIGMGCVICGTEIVTIKTVFSFDKD